MEEVRASLAWLGRCGRLKEMERGSKSKERSQLDHQHLAHQSFCHPGECARSEVLPPLWPGEHLLLLHLHVVKTVRLTAVERRGIPTETDFGVHRNATFSEALPHWSPSLFVLLLWAMSSKFLFPASAPPQLPRSARCEAGLRGLSLAIDRLERKPLLTRNWLTWTPSRAEWNECTDGSARRSGQRHSASLISVRPSDFFVSVLLIRDQ